MDKVKKQSLLWLIAGIIFISVSIHDIFFGGAPNKSGIMIALEVIAGFCCTLNALRQWRKYEIKKAA